MFPCILIIRLAQKSELSFNNRYFIKAYERSEATNLINHETRRIRILLKTLHLRVEN